MRAGGWSFDAHLFAKRASSRTKAATSAFERRGVASFGRFARGAISQQVDLRIFSKPCLSFAKKKCFLQHPSGRGKNDAAASLSVLSKKT
jgi:hypothetical protein